MHISSFINALGIALATIGSVFTLYTILHTEEKVIGTWDEGEKRRKEFPEEKRKAAIGCCLIIAGGVLQIIGQFI